MKVVIKESGVVVAAGQKATIVSNGILVDGVVYGEQDLIIVETSKEVVPFKNTLVNGVVGINPLYTISEEAITQKAIDNYTLELIEGGII